MREKLRFAMVGAGGIAQAYAQAFEGCSEAQLVAVADTRASASEALAAGLGCLHFDSYETMAEQAQFDAVIVCTPPNTHQDISFFFMERRIHVLCEKPLSIDVESARLMLDAAQRFGVYLTMASKFRYVEDVVRAKSLVTSGVIGDVILFENAFTSRVNMSSRWNSKPAISGGGVLIDNGTHSVDLMRYFLGPLAEVQVVEGKRSQGLEVEETVHIFVRSTGGVMGNIDLSWSISKEQENYLSIYGSEGTIKVGWKEAKYRKSSDQEWVVFGRGYDKVQAFRSQLNNFSRAIEGCEPLLITPEDALASVEVVEAAYAALRQSQWITVGRTLNAPRDSAQEIIVEAGRIA
jgi:predicted dehydrogenase